MIQQKKRKTVVIESEKNAVTSFDETNTNISQSSSSNPMPSPTLQQLGISFSELTIEKELGEGSYGKVCLGKWNAAPVASKFCKTKDKIDNFMREIKLMMYV
jgi:hypothetical protein